MGLGPKTSRQAKPRGPRPPRPTIPPRQPWHERGLWRPSNKIDCGRNRPFKGGKYFKGGKSLKRGRAARRDEIEYLDRWSPQMDPEHYARVQLYRKRKEAIAHNRQESLRRNSHTYSSPSNGFQDVRSATNTPRSSKFSLSSNSSTAPSSYTNTSEETSLTLSDLGSRFQDELDTYDNEIRTLKNDEWPRLPNPRAPPHRIKGSEFGRKLAQSMKSWSFAQGVLYGESSVSLRDTDRVHDAKSYRFGVIFSAPHHTPGSIEERWVSVMDPHNTATPYGIVHSKYRKMVVLKAYGEHCICVPIYTHNGRGLEGKPFLQEWVSISDVADPNPAAPEGPHVKLHAVANPDFRGLVVAGRSCIKLSEICSHRYDSPATMEGRLDSDRTLPRKRLLRLVGIVE